MAYDPNLNSGACKNPMTSEASTDFDWYTNEESFDLTSYMSSSANLELCNDDLFQTLFPPNSPTQGPDLKKDELNHFDDEEVENWYQSATSEPASACTSAAPSPVPLNFYNTPPVTPQSDRQRPSSPHHLQFDGLTTPMSSSRFALLRGEEGSFMCLQKQTKHESQSQHIMVKQEPEHSSTSMFSSKGSAKIDQAVHVPDVLSDQETSHVRHLIKRGPPSNSDTLANKKCKKLVKGSEEYFQKRQRNNVAVRRSRDKAKQKAMETQKKVDELVSENEKLHSRVAELTNELTTLKGLLRDMPRMNT